MTDRQTDHATPSVTTGRNYIGSTAMRLNNNNNNNKLTDSHRSSDATHVVDLAKDKLAI